MAHRHDLKERFIREGYLFGLQSVKDDISARLGISKDTAAYMYEKLQKEGYYKRSRIEINLACIGLDKFAWVFVSLNWDTVDEAKFVEKTLALAHVHTIAEVTGEHDFAVKVYGTSLQEIHAFILGFEKLWGEAIIDLQAVYAIEQFKQHYIPVHKEKRVKMKKVDCLLIEEKNTNPNKSLIEIAAENNIHRNTISTRWARLWEEKVVLKESLELTEKGYAAIGFSLKAFIIIKTKPSNESKVVKRLLALEHCQDVFSTMSNTIVAIVRVANSADLASFHKNLFPANKHIRKTNTILFLTKYTRKHISKEELKSIVDDSGE